MKGRTSAMLWTSGAICWMLATVMNVAADANSSLILLDVACVILYTINAVLHWVAPLDKATSTTASEQVKATHEHQQTSTVPRPQRYNPEQ